MKIKYIISTALLFPVFYNMQAQVAIKGDKVYTMAGQAIENGVVLIKDGKIEQVGPAAQVTIPAGYKTYSGKVVTPGLVDAHSTVGFSGILNQKSDQDQLEKTAPIQPELRAIDGYNPMEELVGFLRGKGVTTVHTGHGPGAIISGQTMIAKTYGETIDEVTLQKETMLAMNLESRVSDNYKSPGTRSKGIAMLRAELIKAQEYIKKKSDKDLSKQPATDLKMEALSKLLNGELKALITVNKAADILSAIRIAKEFNLKLVLDGVAEAYVVLDEIKASGATVILHPTMARSNGDMKNMSMETAAILTKAGIVVSLQSGYESYVPKTHVILYEAAIAAANGLSFDDALKSITINAAKAIGVDNSVGSLEKGKDADVVIFDGDPFEYTTHVCTVVVNGKVTDEACK